MASTRTPPKRTRRVAQPFDDRLEVRMYSTEKAKLLVEAEARGLSASDLVRFQLGDLITAAPPQTTPTPAEDAAALSAPPVDLAAAIAEGFGLSRGQAVLKIALGKVTAAGEPWSHPDIPADLLPTVALEGESLPTPPGDPEPAASGT